MGGNGKRLGGAASVGEAGDLGLRCGGMGWALSGMLGMLSIERGRIGAMPKIAGGGAAGRRAAFASAAHLLQLMRLGAALNAMRAAGFGARGGVAPSE